MMRTALLSLVSLALAFTAGCGPKADLVDIPRNVAEAGGLKVEVELPGRNFQTGDDLRVQVTATNTTGKPIEIHSPTGAPVLIRVLRHTMLAPEQVRAYPRTATANILSWTLPAGQARNFVLMVPIEPDWPVEEVLHVTAELNGYGKVAPGVFIIVRQPRGE
jgi:hypothetical protein